MKHDVPSPDRDELKSREKPVGLRTRRRNLASTSAESFLRAAWGHAEAARLIYPHTRSPDGGHRATFFAFYNVLGFAIELYLKAFLSGQGWTVEQLAEHPYQHNLESLLRASIEERLFEHQGLGNVKQSALERIVQIIGPKFRSYSYRYIDDNNDTYEFIETAEYIWPILDDLQFRIQNSGVQVSPLDQI